MISLCLIYFSVIIITIVSQLIFQNPKASWANSKYNPSRKNQYIRLAHLKKVSFQENYSRKYSAVRQ
jgi:hypothetical protein